MSAASGKQLVLVEFEYEYTNREGQVVTIKPNERYILLAKTNDHWWHVRKDERARPIYIPAKYVKELPSDFPSPLDFLEPVVPTSPEPAVGKRSAGSSEEGSYEVSIRVRSPRRHKKKKENRLSTFGVPLDVHDPVQKRGGVPEPPHSRESSKNSKRPSGSELLVPQSPVDDPHSLKSKVPSFSPADPMTRPTQAKPVETPTIKDLEMDHPKPPVEFEDPPETDSDQSQDSEHIYESLSDFSGLRLQDSPVSETAPPLHPAPAPVLVPVPVPAPPPSAPPASQVKLSVTTAPYNTVSL